MVVCNCTGGDWSWNDHLLYGHGENITVVPITRNPRRSHCISYFISHLSILYMFIHIEKFAIKV